MAGRSSTREAVLAAAARLIRERGFEGASVQQIVVEAGYTKGAFYSNFRSKDEMAVALLDQHFERALRWIERHLAGRGDPREEVRETASDFMRWVQDGEWSGLYFQLVAHAAGNEDFRRRFVERWALMRRRLEALFTRWSEARADSPIPIEQVVTTVVLLADGFLLRSLVDPDVSEQDYTTALSVMYRGLEAMAAEAGPRALPLSRDSAPSG